ncbi:MAPEG family protein [Candidatus Uabimicrobium sp. HlEnr_7]|uniref:MAPEG family protein n=1 Tax=Candidatus Uabimicrobium helgolandensis TaxID=3095367 RepID=UPI003556F4CF
MCPIIAMVFLTFIVTIKMYLTRADAIKRGDLDIKFFRVLDSFNVPEDVAKVTRHYTNLYEMPVLFYLGAVLILTLKIDDVTFAIIGWLYVFCRIAHAYIHITYNKIGHRIRVFQLSVYVLITLWIKICYHVVI